MLVCITADIVPLNRTIAPFFYIFTPKRLLTINEGGEDNGCNTKRVDTYLDSPICLLIVSHCEQFSPMAMLRGG